MTWNSPKIDGGNFEYSILIMYRDSQSGYDTFDSDFAEVTAGGEIWQEFSIGLTLVTYKLLDGDGRIMTNCTFEVFVEG